MQICMSGSELSASQFLSTTAVTLVSAATGCCDDGQRCRPEVECEKPRISGPTSRMILALDASMVTSIREFPENPISEGKSYPSSTPMGTRDGGSDTVSGFLVLNG